MVKDTYNNETNSRITEHSEKPTPFSLTVDVKKYEKFLADSRLSEEQKQEFLQTLWNIICEFVSLGFGVHPLQQIENDCEKSVRNAEYTPFLSADVLKSLYQHLPENMKDGAALETEWQKEGVE